MKESFGFILFGIWLGVFMVLGFAGAFSEKTLQYKEGYKQGQIDYANGKIVYKIKPNGDGTTSWQKEK